MVYCDICGFPITEFECPHLIAEKEAYKEFELWLDENFGVQGKLTISICQEERFRDCWISAFRYAKGYKMRSVKIKKMR